MASFCRPIPPGLVFGHFTSTPQGFRFHSVSGSPYLPLSSYSKTIPGSLFQDAPGALPIFPEWPFQNYSRTLIPRRFEDVSRAARIFPEGGERSLPRDRLAVIIQGRGAKPAPQKLASFVTLVRHWLQETLIRRR